MRPRPAGDARHPVTRAQKEAPSKRPGFFTRVWDRLEDKVARLSARSNFWDRICSWVWLPFAFRSGIRIHKSERDSFWAVLPFTRFNRNWYHAMAGAALLGNSEIAGGMFVFGKTGADSTVVCKQLHYKFLRPCVGPACYQIEAQGSIEDLIATGDEFNVTLDIDVVQMVTKKDERERRVGRVEATFHVTPKELVRERRDRRQRVDLDRAAKK
jgi:acyl-coenzyme A thioesterase PaaI-like protein